MHLAFLTPEYPHPDLNAAAGIGTSIKNLVCSLVTQNIMVTVFVYNQVSDSVFEDDGVIVHSVRKRNFKIGGWYLYRKFLQRYINKYIELKKIDALEAPDWTGITAFMKLKCPIVIRLHGSDAYFCKLEERNQKNKNFWFEKSAINGADHIISVSEFTAKETRKLFDIKSEIAVIHNGINTKEFKSNSSREEQARVFYFGTLIRKKGVLELAEIFKKVLKQIPDAEMVFAGSNVIDNLTKRSTQELIEEIAGPETSVQMQFLGKLGYEDIRREIAKATVVVFPSYAEAFPMTWLEAMAMEKALVTSNIGWANEIMINGKTGFTAHPKDHDKFASQIIQFIQHPTLRMDMGKNARQTILDNFSIDVIVKKNLTFYNKTLGI